MSLAQPTLEEGTLTTRGMETNAASDMHAVHQLWWHLSVSEAGAAAVLG